MLYASKLFEIIERHLPDVHTYADDTQLYISFNADSSAEQSAAVEAMQNCIADIREWLLRDRLRLNDGKTEFIIIGTRLQPAKVTIDTLQVGESVITPASEVKDLGCWFDRHLKMDTHINKISKAAFFQLFNIRRIRKFLGMGCTKIIVNAFDTSRLNYCNSLLYGLPNNHKHVCKTQLHFLSAMLVDSIISLLLCTVSTGYPLSFANLGIECHGGEWTCL